MSFFEYVRIATRVLRAHKFRSALTVLSITVGAFSIVLMSSLAESGLATLSRGIEDLGGARLIDIAGKPPERGERKRASYARGITVQDRDAIFTALPGILDRSLFSTVGRRDVWGDTGVGSRTDTVAADAGFLGLFRMRLASGRGFSDEENRQHAKVCVVGHKLAVTHWNGDALGHWLTVSAPGGGAVRCHVIGQLADQDRWGINFGFDWLDVVVLPYATLGDVDPTVVLGADILVKTRDPSQNELTKRIMNALLVERHHGVDDFEIFDFARFMDKFHAFFAVLEAIVGFIAGIALLVGGVGVMNMMLVSVSERVREIGIRKALGASPRDIALQFLFEAIVLSGSGGLLGVVLGVAGALGSAALIQSMKPVWVGVVAEGAVVTALCVSVGVGLVFGFFPARRAARLDAIAAIRS
jgi:putative ABC transport system permease protein